MSQLQREQEPGGAKYLGGRPGWDPPGWGWGLCGVVVALPSRALRDGAGEPCRFPPGWQWDRVGGSGGAGWGGKGFGGQSMSQSICFSGGPGGVSYQQRQKHGASRPGVRAGSSGRD